MTNANSNNFYFWCCIAQSLVIVALAFYTGTQKSEKEELLKEKEMNNFTLMVRESEISRLKAAVDTCHGEKK